MSGARTSSEQLSSYVLAWNEIKHAWLSMGVDDCFLGVVERVEKRLIHQYPEDAVAIIEMVVAWQVTIGAAQANSLRGFI